MRADCDGPINVAIPFGQVPAGSFFRLAGLPRRRFQKTRLRECALDERAQMVLFKEQAVCVVEEKA